MTEDIYTKAQLLAEAISVSEEFGQLRRAEKAMLADTKAQEVISRFQEAQEQVTELQREGKAPEKDVDLAETIREQMRSNPVIASYLSAQDSFSEMLDKVNTILASAIAGETNP